MFQVNGVTLQFGSRILFKDVYLKFTPGNCYGVIGANGAGKSTFLRLLSGELEPSKGDVSIEKGKRLSVLKQDHERYNDYTVLNTVLEGHQKLMKIARERDELYAKTDFTDQEALRISELEIEFGELGGYEAESQAASLLVSLEIPLEKHQLLMKQLTGKEKVRVLLAQALFGNPDVLLLDEPTNNLDIANIRWLENFLLNFDNTVIVVSHDRHFLNKVCTHILDVDFQAINLYLGNYDFWYESSQLVQRQLKDENKKAEQKIKELQDFIARFSANASKSKQATSRKKELEKIQLNDIKPSNRRYPYIDFSFDRRIGNDILKVENLTKKGYFENLSFTIYDEQKVALICDNSLVTTMLYSVLSGEIAPDSGSYKWGVTIIHDYQKSNIDYLFNNKSLNLIDWLRQYSKDQSDVFIRSWLGRMLFAKDEVFKTVSVLSGGEKVRMAFSKLMLSTANFIFFEEPENHLDLEAITSLNKALNNYKGNLMITTHDHEIYSSVCNRVIEIKDGKIVFDKAVTYDEYLDIILEPHE